MTNAAYRIYRKFKHHLKERVKQEAEKIAEAPYQCDKLSGLPIKVRSCHFSFGGTSYRIAYEIDEANKTIYIKLVKTREKFYNQLKRILGLK
jgi:mRNA-degrading endonuclease RelE of RelBE toxin-antitoxin system